MTGRAARIASAVLLASLVPLAANVASEVQVVTTNVAAVLNTTGSTGPTNNQTAKAHAFDAPLITQRDANVAADENVRTGGSFIRAAGAVVPAQIKT
jgi:hypothetical protein